MPRPLGRVWGVASIAAIVVAALALTAAPASAAPLAKHLGEVSVVGKEQGGCECTIAQFGDAGPTEASYAIPFNGVITKTGFRVGEATASTDWGQARVITKTGVSAGTVFSEGEQHFFNGSTPFSIVRYDERIQAKSGDVLGVRFHDSPFIGQTPAWFETTSTEDKAGLSATSLEVGGSFSVTPAEKRRINLEAVIETDEDEDGYGDYSQDLCPGSPIAITACSGALFGSNLQGARAFIGECGFSCVRVQKSIAGASTVAPYDGFVSRWRVLNAKAGQYSIRVLAPDGAGGYTVRGSSEAGTVTAPSPVVASKISSFETHVPICVGDYVGIVPPSGSNEGFRSEAGSTYEQLNDSAAEGSTITQGSGLSGLVMYDADIEPSAQPGCPSSEGGGGEGGSSGGGGSGSGGGGGGSGPEPRVALGAKVPAQPWKTIAKAKAVKVRCSVKPAGTCRATATVTKAAAKRLGLKVAKRAKTLKVGSGSVRVTKAGKLTNLKLRLTGKARAAIAKATRNVPLTLKITGSASGYEAATLTRHLTISR